MADPIAVIPLAGYQIAEVTHDVADGIRPLFPAILCLYIITYLFFYF